MFISNMSEPNFQVVDGRTNHSDISNLERAMSERIYFSQVRPRLEQSEKMHRYTPRQRNCLMLFEQGESDGINPDDISKHTEEKREALRNIMGYNGLRGASSLNSARPEVIGEVYKKDFYQGKALER